MTLVVYSPWNGLEQLGLDALTPKREFPCTYVALVLPKPGPERSEF